MLWSSYFHYLSQPRRYPRALAGRTLGYCNLVIACASELSPFGLNLLVLRSQSWGLGLGAGHVAVHLILLVLLFSCLAFPYFLWREHCQHERQKSLARASSGRSARFSTYY